MNKNTPKLTIRPCKREDLDKLPGGLRRQHDVKRFQLQQKGETIYLIAFLAGAPVGRMMLCWEPDRKALKEEFLNHGFLKALRVEEDYQDMGVGTSLVQEGEGVLKRKGFKKVGLSVGVRNKKAINLYRKLGYSKARLNPYIVRWSYMDETGKKRHEQEKSIFMVKNL